MIHYNKSAGLSDLPATVDEAVRQLRPHLSEFDSIAVQGVSGLLVGSPVSISLGKPLIVVRKTIDFEVPYCSHIKIVENAERSGYRVLFLDDYVGEGKTLRDVSRKLRDFTSGRITCRYETERHEYTSGDAALIAPYDDDPSNIIRQILQALGR